MSDSRGAGRRILLACDFHRHYCAMLAGALDRQGADVTMVTRDHDLEFGGRPGAARDFVDEATGDGVDLRLIEGRVRDLQGWRQGLGLRRGLSGADYVHLQESIGNDPRLLLAAGLPRRPFALTVHDPVRHPGDYQQRWGRHIHRVTVRAAKLIFVHAEALREELIEVSDPPGEIVVVPHGIDPADATPLPDEPAILFFGRLSYYKGLDVLLDAMAAVWKAVPAATLTIAGAGEVDPHPALEDPRVTLRVEHIPESEVGDLINASTCVALPYRQASQSGVGSRVKPYARALVVSAVGGLPELVSDGSGLVVPPEDPESFAAALVSILSDREAAERLGAAGAATAQREGSWDVVAGLTLAAYEEYLGGRR